jgi:hypothetical protein
MTQTAQNLNAIGTVAAQEFIFKGESRGTSKKSGQAYHMIELHDPSTLENVSFFIREGSSVSTTGINFKDRVLASFGMEVVYGKLQPALHQLKKL